MQALSLEALRQAATPGWLWTGGDIPGKCWSLAATLYGLWQGKFRAGRAPAWADFVAADLIPVMPRLVVLDVEAKPFRLKTRMMGTDFVTGAGLDATGHYVDDFANTDDVGARAQWVVAYGEPLLVTDVRLAWSSNNYRRYDSLCLPLPVGDGTVAHLLYVSRFHQN